MDEITQLLETIISAVTDTPDSVIIRRVARFHKVNFYVQPRQDQIGQLVGMDGRIIDSIRIILNCHARKLHIRERIFIEVVQDIDKHIQLFA